MSAARLSYRCGPATIELDPDGSLVSVVHDRRPGWRYLVGGGRPELVIDGRPIDWSNPAVLVDTDEVEFEWTAGEVQVVVRHSFVLGWGVRVAISNPSDHELIIDRAGLGWRPHPDAPGWAVAAGATGSYAIPPPDGTGPLLAGTSSLGCFAEVDDQTIGFGPLALSPNGRFVVQWTWDWYAGAAEFARGRDRHVPRTLDVITDETVVIATDDDTAVVLPGGVINDGGDGSALLFCWEEGRFLVELLGVRGRTAYELRAARPLTDQFAAAAELAMAGPVSRTGVVELADVHAALAVQQALRAGQLADAYAAEDALDRFLARLLTSTEGDAFAIAFAAGEAERAGTDEPLDAAEGWLRGQSSLAPGIGLAAGRVGLGLMLRDQPVQALLDQLHQLSVPDGPLAPAIRLEQAVLTTRRAAPDRRSALIADALAVGAQLGSGLKGRAVRELPAETLAYLSVVLGLVSEDLAVPLGGRWAASVYEVAHRAEAQALFGRERRPAGPALSWLTLAARPTEG